MLLREGDLHPCTNGYASFFCITLKNTLDGRVAIALPLCNIKVATAATKVISS